MGSRSRLWEIPEGKDGKGDCATALHDEQVAPVGQGARFDLKNAECEESSEGRGDALSGIEESEAAGKFVTTIKAIK